jgi:hypothetical protein
MKKTCLASMIVAFLFLWTNGMQAQNTPTKLNQVELMKQFVGSWKCEIGKDTTILADQKAYGAGFEDNFKIVTQGKIIEEGKDLYGYDKRTDKFIDFLVTKGGGIVLYSCWFISKDTCKYIYYKEIADPEKAVVKWTEVFKSPDLFIQTRFRNNKTVKIDTWTKVKE